MRIILSLLLLFCVSFGFSVDANARDAVFLQDTTLSDGQCTYEARIVDNREAFNYSIYDFVGSGTVTIYRAFFRGAVVTSMLPLKQYDAEVHQQEVEITGTIWQMCYSGAGSAKVRWIKGKY